MNVPEILAPAGGEEQLIAAVRCGADAVYLGAKRFNARQNAANFDDDALAKAARYCRARGVRLCVAVNTMVRGDELSALAAEADALAEAGVDAVILQDMAAARLFERRCPGIRRAASTQTAVHNIDGARFLRDAGFDSFVLARELTLDEMAAIIDAVPLPAEAFVHGAHCMSVSGMCALSAMLGGRSGNRGLCAQPCRLPWRCGGCDHALSLKDMSLVRHIPALARIGVRTLKIEGRMKRPEYVAAAVTACRAARDGEAYDEETLRAVFSRSGFTDGYLTGKRDRDMFGYRTREDVVGAGNVLGSLRALYRREYPRIPVNMSFLMNGNGTTLTVSDGERTVTKTGPAPQPAATKPLDRESAENSLRRTGGTQYYVNQLSTELAPGMTLPASLINALRREAIEELDLLRGAPEPRVRAEEEPWEPYAAPTCRRDEAGRPSPLWARFYRAGQLAGDERLARVILPIDEIGPALLERLGGKLTAALPAVCFPADEARLFGRVTELKARGLRELWTENIYGIALAERAGLAVRGGFGLNIANRVSAGFYAAVGVKSLTASFELSMAEIRELAGITELGLAVYGRLPLMRYRNCPVRAQRGCGECGGTGSLIDRKGVSFPVECGQRRYSTLLNSVPLDIAGRDDPGDFRLLWFTRESPDEVSAVIERFEKGRRTDAPHTGGLYYRSVI